MRFFTPLRCVQNDMIEGGLSGSRSHSNVDMSAQPDFRIMRPAGCHSEHQTVIPSATRNLIKSPLGCRMRFFTPLRSVQNDMAEGGAPFRMTWRGRPVRMT